MRQGVDMMGLNDVMAVLGRCKAQYIRALQASIMTLFAIAGPIVIASAGMALDMSQAYLVRERLGHALDSAALAAASLAATDEAAANLRLQAFMNANYPPEKMGTAYNLNMVVEGDNVRVSANADYDTAFLWILGIEEITVYSETVVQREVQGLEVVLVLDNTGSMATDNNIRALKEAATNFINILFANTSNPNTIKVGMVPYSNAVRVGRYGIGRTPEGDTYNGGERFVTLPDEVSYTSNHDSSSGWYGCVVEHMDDDYNPSATHVSGSRGQLWKTGNKMNGHGWNPEVNTNDPYPDDVSLNWQGPWDIYQYGTVSRGSCSEYENQCTSYGNVCVSSHEECTRYRSNGQCRTWTTVCDEYEYGCQNYQNVCTSYNYTFNPNSTPNNGCPYANVVPLTSDQDYLLEQVEPDVASDMKPHGNTLGNIGMIWGARVLSPEPPFTEAQPWENKMWRKAIVMMTDGVNTDDSNYSAYWFSNKNQMNTTKFNNRFLEICESLKDEDVVIYTITFGDGAGSVTSYYRDCATSESKYSMLLRRTI